MGASPQFGAEKIFPAAGGKSEKRTDMATIKGTKGNDVPIGAGFAAKIDGNDVICGHGGHSGSMELHGHRRADRLPGGALFSAVLPAEAEQPFRRFSVTADRETACSQLLK